MNCPKCGGKTSVEDSRTLDDVVARKRMCKECGHWFYTEEIEVVNNDTLREWWAVQREKKRSK